MNRALLLFGGFLWLLFAIGFVAILVHYVSEGAGLQIFGPAVSAGSVLLGLAHVIGFATAALVCFAVGVGLGARGIVNR
jgi:hypothetical protein